MKLDKWILQISFFFIHTVLTLQAEESKPLTLDSELLDYNETVITLKGRAVVDHELGKVEADEILVIPEKEGKKMRVAHLKMSDQVKIALADGGQLSCAQAVIDIRQMNGRFLGDVNQEDVIYVEYFKEGQTTSSLLEVKAKEMNLQLKKGIQNHTWIIHQIKALEKVRINYNHDFLGEADEGIYERQEQSGSQEKAPLGKVLGVLSLYARGPSGKCQVSHQNGDQIQANKITLDILKRELQFDAPQGILHLKSNKEKHEPIVFTCSKMVWNEPSDTLFLTDQVSINYGIGTLTNPHEVIIDRHLVDGHKQLHTIESLGPTVFTYQDEKKHEQHVLTTHSKFILDHQLKRAILESPRDIDNRVLQEYQVNFSDPLGEIYADEMIITYKEMDKTIVPEKLFLKGNICMLSRSSIDKDLPGKFLQFAIADRVEYDIAAREMICLADSRKRVLFFDKSNNLQISAPSVKIRRDALSKKESIQGMGDVRFSFIDKEFDQLKKRLGAIYE